MTDHRRGATERPEPKKPTPEQELPPQIGEDGHAQSLLDSALEDLALVRTALSEQPAPTRCERLTYKGLGGIPAALTRLGIDYGDEFIIAPALPEHPLNKRVAILRGRIDALTATACQSNPQARATHRQAMVDLDWIEARETASQPEHPEQARSDDIGPFSRDKLKDEMIALYVKYAGSLTPNGRHVADVLDRAISELSREPTSAVPPEQARCTEEGQTNAE
jgi:hypothetical protein